MKKFITLALCAACVGSMSAQKDVLKQAEKLAGKNDQITEARSLIQQAISNPETQNDPQTYFLGGKIEFDAFDNSFKKQMINPNDPSVNPEEMGQQLLEGYKLFVKALPLDSMPNEKGQVKPKYAKNIISILNGHYNDFFNAGGNFYNAKKYYPEAYEAFMIYGDFPSQGFAMKEIKATPDSVLSSAYFNAGLSGWAGNELEAAAKGFHRAAQTAPDNKQAYIYEIACWQNIAGKDSTRVAEAEANIMNIAKAGYDKFGVEEPLFLNNMINSMVSKEKYDESLALLADVIAANPDNANLYGLRGFINDRAGRDQESVADYRKATEMPNVDFETLKNAAKKIFKEGTVKWNEIEGAAPEARQEVKKNYFDAAKAITDKAKTMKSDDSDLNYVIENIDYVLETYFQ